MNIKQVRFVFTNVFLKSDAGNAVSISREFNSTIIRMSDELNKLF
jgi:hypothetical protein